MEPQGGRRISAFRVTKRSTKLRRPSKTTRSRVHVQTVGLNAETKKVSAPSRRRRMSLDIPFYRTCPITAFTRVDSQWQGIPLALARNSLSPAAGGAYDSRNSGPNQKTDFRRYGLRKPLLAGGVDEIFRGSYHDFDLPYWSSEHDKFSSNDRL